jgi:hypothetical protein
MNTDPTPPPPFKIINKDYLLNGGTLPGDLISSMPELGSHWKDSCFQGRQLNQHHGNLVSAGRIFYASAQLDHECFRGAPSGAQGATKQATVEPASTECLRRQIRFDDKSYWPAFCPRCGWVGMSDETKGGSPIADTGDFNAIVCPECLEQREEWVDVLEIQQPNAGQPAPSTPAPFAAKLPESAALIARVREAAMNDTPTPLTDAADAEIQTHQTYWDSKYWHLCDFARSLERQIPRWLPIESAPRDGTPIMLAWPFWSDHPVVGWWSAKWNAWESNVNLNHEEPPTHWMPLPEPPKP